MDIKYFENDESLISRLYDEFLVPNFLEEELKPLEIIINLFNEGFYKVISMVNDNENVAVAFLVISPNKDSYLLDYFAVEKNKRSQGFGSMFLEYLLSNFGDQYPIIIETESLLESIDVDNRRRRQLFYVNNGAKKTIYNALIFECLYDIWYLSEVYFEDKDIVDKYDEIYKFMLSEDMYKNNCNIPYFS